MPEAEAISLDTLKQKLSATQKKSEEYRRTLSDEEYQALRNRAKTDLYYLIKSVLGYGDLSTGLHGHLCAWLQRNEKAQFRCILLPRAHFKSTIVTIGLNIQRALRNPNIRILIAHESHFGSQRFLQEIQSHFLSNPKLQALFPELVPDPRIQRINVSELELPRAGHWAEPTFDTLGVGARSQGRHYDHITLDDIFGDKARDSVTESERLKIWFDNIQSFLMSPMLSSIDIVGTRYSFDDVYDHAFNQYEDQLLRYIRRVEEPNALGILEPIFPERFTTDSLKILRKNPEVWASQYCNDPAAGLAEFKKEWMKFYEWGPGRRITGHYNKEWFSVELRRCQKILLVDPARKHGLTGMVVTACDHKNRVFILDAIKDRFTDTDFMNILFSLVVKYGLQTVVIEEVLFSGLYKPWIESEQRLRNLRFQVLPGKRRRIGSIVESKHKHISALSNYFVSGNIYFHKTQENIIEEFTKFGATDDVHMLDALAYGPSHWRPGAFLLDDEKTPEIDLLKDRDLLTGYSTY